MLVLLNECVHIFPVHVIMPLFCCGAGCFDIALYVPWVLFIYLFIHLLGRAAKKLPPVNISIKVNLMGMDPGEIQFSRGCRAVGCKPASHVTWDRRHVLACHQLR